MSFARFSFKPAGAARLALPLLILSAVLVSCAPREAIKKQVYQRPQVAEKPGERYHTIRKGETLYSVARLYGVTVQDIENANNIKDVRDIEVGTRLLIPKPGAVPRMAPRGARPPGKQVEAPPPSAEARFAWPLESFSVSSRFGVRHSRKHDGIDLRANRGASILAAADGKVIYSGWGPSGYGRIVIIKHEGGFITVYAHNEKNFVQAGNIVRRGQKIAAVGRSGRASGYHLHFEIRVNRKPSDPEKYLPKLK